MSFAVEVLPEDRLVRAKWYGASDSDDARAAVAVIRSEIGAHPVEGVLIDLRGARYALTPDEAADVGMEFASFLGRRRLAFLTTSPADERVVRLIARRAAPEGIEVDVFRDEHSAMEWLHSPDFD